MHKLKIAYYRPLRFNPFSSCSERSVLRDLQLLALLSERGTQWAATPPRSQTPNTVLLHNPLD